MKSWTKVTTVCNGYDLLERIRELANGTFSWKLFEQGRKRHQRTKIAHGVCKNLSEARLEAQKAFDEQAEFAMRFSQV